MWPGRATRAAGRRTGPARRPGARHTGELARGISPMYWRQWRVSGNGAVPARSGHPHSDVALATGRQTMRWVRRYRRTSDSLVSSRPSVPSSRSGASVRFQNPFGAPSPAAVAQDCTVAAAASVAMDPKKSMERNPTLAPRQRGVSAPAAAAAQPPPGRSGRRLRVGSDQRSECMADNSS